MEQYHNGDDFTIGHFGSPVASFSPRAIINAIFIQNLVQFYAKIVDKTKNFRNFIGRDHKQNLS
jgi:hypothetical protein